MTVKATATVENCKPVPEWPVFTWNWRRHKIKMKKENLRGEKVEERGTGAKKIEKKNLKNIEERKQQL